MRKIIDICVATGDQGEFYRECERLISMGLEPYGELKVMQVPNPDALMGGGSLVYYDLLMVKYEDVTAEDII